MHSKSLSKCFAKPAEVFTVIVILLLAVFIVQMIALGIEMIITIQKTNEWTTNIHKEPKEPTLQEKIDRSHKEFLPDGTVLLMYEKYNRANRQDVIQIHDANNNLVWEGVKTYDTNSSKYLLNGTNEAPEYLRWNIIYEETKYRSAEWIQKIRPDFSETIGFKSNIDKEAWQYDFKGYFTGYTYERQPIGYIGLNGFVKNKSEIKPFGKLMFWDHQRQTEYEKQPASPVIWVTTSQVCQLNIANRKVDVLLNTEGSRIKESCFTGMSNYDFVPVKTSAIKYRPVMDFVTEDNIHHLILREPEQTLNVSLPNDCLGRIDGIAFTATENGIFFKIILTDQSLSPAQRRRLWANEEYMKKEHKKWIGLYKVNQNGPLELVSRYDWTTPAIKAVNGENSVILHQRCKPYITAFSPPIYDWVWRKYSDYISDYYYENSIPFQQYLESSKNPGLSICHSTCLPVWLLWVSRSGTVWQDALHGES